METPGKYHQLSNKHIEIKYVFQHPHVSPPQKLHHFHFALAKSASTAKTSPFLATDIFHAFYIWVFP